MEKIKIIYIGSLVILALLVVFIIHQISSKPQSEVAFTLKQDVATVGEEIFGGAEIYNPYDERKYYIYTLYFDDTIRFEDDAFIAPKGRFGFTWRNNADKPGTFKATLVVYEGNKERLIENVSYYVNVNPR